ncbi:MAG: PrsW family intramembrane metalloprotease [Spirochaetales bacterium]|nr:MAG: PrsW family intramembrane metalloprotease [Spirochaetales bacterium]
MLLVSILLAVIPAFLLLVYFYKKDRQKPERFGRVMRVFAFGILSVIPAIIIELVLDSFLGEGKTLLLLLVEAFIVAALVEESLKLATVRLFAYNRPEFDEITDGIVYTVAASLGFAVLENILYSLDGSVGIVLIRGITAVPLHAIASGIMGYYIGLSKMSGKSYIGRGLLFAVLIHGVYDFVLFTETGFAFLVIPLLVICWFILRNLNKKALAEDRESGRS